MYDDLCSTESISIISSFRLFEQCTDTSKAVILPFMSSWELICPSMQALPCQKEGFFVNPKNSKTLKLEVPLEMELAILQLSMDLDTGSFMASRTESISNLFHHRRNDQLVQAFVKPDTCRRGICEHMADAGGICSMWDASKQQPSLGILSRSRFDFEADVFLD
jgi:hypothetical protein